MHQHTSRQAPKEHRETRELLTSAFRLGQSLGIKSLVVQGEHGMGADPEEKREVVHGHLTPVPPAGVNLRG